MKKIYTTFVLGAAIICSACSDEIKTPLIDFANDVTFNKEENSIDIDVPEFTYLIPDSPFKARAYKEGEITFNVKKNPDGTHTGFALSSKNWRSFPWGLSRPHGYATPTGIQTKAAVDSCIFSVASGTYPNQLKTFTVVRVDGDEAYFTIDKPRIVEHILVANTTYNYLLYTYGSHYSSYFNKNTYSYEEKDASGANAYTRNPFIPNTAVSMYGYFSLPDYYGFRNGNDYISLSSLRTQAKSEKGIDNAPEYIKLIAVGYNNGKETAKCEYYIATLTGSAPAPYDTWNLVQAFWAPWDLSPLGAVDKVVFRMESTDVDANGKMMTPPYFCLDGIRLK
ncbi:MAG: DUF4465 domain-containing protein [Bacteroidales bacterium]|nr:DUF4465 domain-containing protein [Bacteroidales bacterium]